MKNKKILILILIACVAGVGVLLACKTPVYKYAILNWREQEPYQILRLYDSTKGQSENDAAIQKAFEEKANFTNIGILPIDVSQDLDTIYGEGADNFIKGQLGDNTTPYYVMVNPKKAIVYKGNLKPDQVEPLIMSPKRKELAEKLSVGNVCLILVESKDAEKNKKAEEILKKSIVSSTDVDLEIRSQENQVPKSDLNPLKITYVTVSPIDQKEEWFYRQMTHLSPAVPQNDEPKLFGVVGRAFIFEQPLSGEYFTQDQIEALILFLSGPCSCTVKAENAGVDIVMQWDWDKHINVKLDPWEEDDQESVSVAGFGGEEVTETNNASNSSSSAQTAETSLETNQGKQNTTLKESKSPLTELDFFKTILFAVGGVALVLLLLTKFMKVDKE